MDWSGPLPPPAALDHFNQVIPGGAERILAMAEKEQSHRIEAQNTMLVSEVADTKRGQIFGFLIAFGSIAGAIALAIVGAPWQVACALVGVPVLGVVKALVDGRRNAATTSEAKK